MYWDKKYLLKIGDILHNLVIKYISSHVIYFLETLSPFLFSQSFYVFYIVGSATTINKSPYQIASVGAFTTTPVFYFFTFFTVYGIQMSTGQQLLPASIITGQQPFAGQV